VPHQDAFLPAFATPIFTRQLRGNEALHARLLEAVRGLEQAGRSDDRYRSHQGGFYTPGTLFNDCVPPFTDVRDLFRAAVRAYVDQVASTGHGRKQAIPDHWIHLQGWAALTRAGDYQPPHAHAGSNLSCVYYVAVPAKPDPQGTLDLLNPLVLQEMTFIPGGNTTHCRIVPRAGMLVIFPAYVLHTVHPFYGEGERVCIVANAIIRPA